MVRGLGSGVSHHPFCADRPGFRQTPAITLVAGMVPIAEWAVTRLRMGIRRRKSAGPSVGLFSRVQDRQEADGQGGLLVPGVRVPQAADELHLVGEPQGLAGQQHLRGRIPGPGQHRRVRSKQAAAHRRFPGAGGRHCLDGDVLPHHAQNRHRAYSTRSLVRGHRE